jgi:ribose transport system ATP-binding protein
MHKVEPSPINYEAKTRLDGMEIRLASPRKAIESGVALLSKDRKATGLVLSQSIIANAALTGLRQFSFAGRRLRTREHTAAEQTTSLMRLRAASLTWKSMSFPSATNKRSPSQNGSKSIPDFSSTSLPAVLTSPPKEINQLMNQWTAQGIAVLLITSEMTELLTLSDRIAVMQRGQVTAEFSRNQAAPKTVLSAAMRSISLVHAPDFQN